MAKITLKKHLQSMSKEHAIEFILEVYKNNKPSKEYIDYVLNPNEKEMLEKYRQIIIDEFYPDKNTFNPKTRFSACKRAISEFRSLKPAPELLADLMLTLPETACKFTYEYGDMWEQFYDSAETNFNIALKYIEKNGLLDSFKQRIRKCVEYASPCGYGFCDAIESLYYEYYQD